MCSLKADMKCTELFRGFSVEPKLNACENLYDGSTDETNRADVHSVNVRLLPTTAVEDAPVDQ